jgi:hypothetical protein
MVFALLYFCNLFPLAVLKISIALQILERTKFATLLRDLPFTAAYHC